MATSDAEGGAGRLRSGLVQPRFQGLLVLPQPVDLLTQGVVLVGQILQHLGDVVQLVQALQHLAAAIGHSRGLRRSRVGDGANRVAGAAGPDRAALVIGHREHDAPVHEAGDVRGAVDRVRVGNLGRRFAARDGLNLVGAGAILHQEIPHRVGAIQAQLLVEAVRADPVRVAFHADLVAGVGLQQFG